MFLLQNIHLKIRISYSKLPIIVIFCLVIFSTLGFSSHVIPERNPTSWRIEYIPVDLPLGWHALPGKGLNGQVRALALLGDNLYVGGHFNATGDGTTLTDLGNIVRYNISTGTWHNLPNDGLNGWVYALAVLGNDLYVGGNFDATGDGTLSDLGNITRYDPNLNSWQPLARKGLNGWVITLAVSGRDLYAGGNFSTTGDLKIDLSNIARYDTSSPEWYSLPEQPNQGLNGLVFALAVDGRNLFVGGEFTQTAGGPHTTLNHIARYNNGTWYPMDKGGLDNNVLALVVSGGDLYVGGLFTETSDASQTNLGHIVRYDIDDEEWIALNNEGLNSNVYALEMSGDDLYVGGTFNATGDNTETGVYKIARYNIGSETWFPLPENGPSNKVNALKENGSDLYVGGSFLATNRISLVQDLNNIARFGPDYPEVKAYLPLSFKE